MYPDEKSVVVREERNLQLAHLFYKYKELNSLKLVSPTFELCNPACAPGPMNAGITPALLECILWLE